MSNKHTYEINEEGFSEANVSLWHFSCNFFPLECFAQCTCVVWQVEAFLCATICYVKWEKNEQIDKFNEWQLLSEPAAEIETSRHEMTLSN